MKWIGFLLAALFVILIIGAQAGCPIQNCHGPEGDGWMLPFFFAPIGLPALMWSMIFGLSKVRPQSKGIHYSRKYFFVGIIVMWILVSFMIGIHNKHMVQPMQEQDIQTHPIRLH